MEGFVARSRFASADSVRFVWGDPGGFIFRVMSYFGGPDYELTAALWGRAGCCVAVIFRR